MNYHEIIAAVGEGSAHPGGFKGTLDFMEFIGITPGLRVLEVGCGTGRTACLLAQMGAQVTAMDQSIVMLEKAEHRAQQQQLQIEWIQGDITAIPLRSDTYDAVIAESVTVFTADPALREAAAAGAANLPGPWIVRGYDDGDEGLADCRSIVLIDPPPSEERLAAVLAACREPSAVYALYELPETRYPDRSAFTAAYRLLRDALAEPARPDEVRAILGKSDLPPDLAELALEVFRELGFLEFEDGRIRLAPNPAKRSLEESAAYREAVRAAEARRLWSAPAAELAAWIGRKAPACREYGQEPNGRLQPAGSAFPQGG